MVSVFITLLSLNSCISSVDITGGNNEQPTTNNGERRTNNEERTTENEQRTTNNAERTTKNENIPTFYSDTEVQTKDKVYKENIKSVLCFNSNNEIAAPIIAFNSEEYITIRFDDLDNNIKTYNYSIMHCNADWTQSDLLEIEYLDGYFQGNISTYDYSFNTYMPFINYKFDFPNSNTKVLIPGNYVIFVYEANDKENPVLTRRIMIYQLKANITYEYKRSDDPEERYSKQEIDFSVFTNNLTLNSGASDLSVCILQNYRWDNALTKLSPKYQRNQELVYNLDEPQTFLGWNEFRHVNISNNKIKGSKVFELSHDSTLYKAVLYCDNKRSYKKYATYGDINGRFKINRENNSGDTHSQADYMWVTFSVDQNTEVKEGDIYIIGQFSDWEIKPENKCHFNSVLNVYEATLTLKQGYYDYMYVMVPKGKTDIDFTFIEGTQFDTENQYTILVYYHDIKRNTDLLYGYLDFNNVKKN